MKLVKNLCALKCEVFLDQLSDHQHLKKHSTPWSYTFHLLYYTTTCVCILYKMNTITYGSKDVVLWKRCWQLVNNDKLHLTKKGKEMNTGQ
jgi:hypothetical protein